VNSAVAGPRCLGGAAATTDRKPFTVSTTTLAMEVLPRVKASVFCLKGLYESLSENFSGRGATRNFDGGMLKQLGVELHPQKTPKLASAPDRVNAALATSKIRSRFR
jgi:hypothetical protein